MTAYTKDLSDTMAITDSLSKSIAMSLSDTVRIRELLCIPITIDHTKVVGDLVDFPVGINERDLPDAFWQCVAADGLNILVKDAFGTVLKREVVSIDLAAETFEMWFKVPALSASVDTIVYVFLTTGSYANDSTVWERALPCGMTNGSGVATECPVSRTLTAPLAVNVTTEGTFDVTVPSGQQVTVTSGTAAVTDSPKVLTADGQITVTGTGTITFTVGGYVAVYHMNNNPADSTKILDSTANGNVGTKGAGAAAPVEVAGTEGRAQSFDGADDKITLPFVAGLKFGVPSTALSMTMLVQSDSANLRSLVGQAGGGAYDALQFRYKSTLADNRVCVAFDRVDGNPGTNRPLAATSLAAYKTMSIVTSMPALGAALAAGHLLAYANGVSLGAATAVGVLDASCAAAAGITIGTGSAGYCPELIDELRLSSVARSAEWNAAEDASLRGIATFYSVGAPSFVAMAFGKAIADSVAIADYPAKAIGKPLADSVAIADAIVKAMGIEEAETLAITDALAKDIGLYKADAVTIADVIAKALGMPLADTLAITDTLSKEVGVILTETMLIADSVVKSIGLGKADTMVIADAIAKHMTKALADAMAIVDSVVMTGTYARPGIQVAAFLFSRAINALLYPRDITAKHRREF